MTCRSVVAGVGILAEADKGLLIDILQLCHTLLCLAHGSIHQHAKWVRMVSYKFRMDHKRLAVWPHNECKRGRRDYPGVGQCKLPLITSLGESGAWGRYLLVIADGHIWLPYKFFVHCSQEIVRCQDGFILSMLPLRHHMLLDGDGVGGPTILPTFSLALFVQYSHSDNGNQLTNLLIHLSNDCARTH